MRISAEKLSREAESTGFRPDVLEKAAHLLSLLNTLRSHPFLKGKLALKGGTALNLFIFDIPRLSVDIDINYIGAEDREGMLGERPAFEQAINAVFSREGFIVRHIPQEHAGGKWALRFQSASGQRGNLEVDINFMFRVSLWPIELRNSHLLGAWQAIDIPVLDIHELAAGKLAALMTRQQARDVFDCHRILHMQNLDQQKLRIAFVTYGAMNRKDWRLISVDDVEFDTADFARQLVPILRSGTIKDSEPLAKYGQRLVDECRQGMSILLPFSDAERGFLDLLLDKGEIDPALLTPDVTLQNRIRRHPLLEWKALNVRRHKRDS